MPVETAVNFQQLDKTWPLNGDLLGPAETHIKTLKQVLKTIFPGVNTNGYNVAITALETELNFVQGLTSNAQAQIDLAANNLMGIEDIIPYAGAFANIPANFNLCDGSNGTPNMTDKFVYGTATQGDVLATGGSADQLLISHNHVASHGHTSSLTSQGTHTHLMDLFTNSAGPVKKPIRTAIGSVAVDKVTDSDGAHNHTPTINSATTSTSTTGSSGTGKNLPKYAKLAFIMRVS